MGQGVIEGGGLVAVGGGWEVGERVKEVVLLRVVVSDACEGVLEEEWGDGIGW